jgi:hypothetical protein
VIFMVFQKLVRSLKFIKLFLGGSLGGGLLGGSLLGGDSLLSGSGLLGGLL